jgi:hypothetical protein
MTSAASIEKLLEVLGTVTNQPVGAYTLHRCENGKYFVIANNNGRYITSGKKLDSLYDKVQVYMDGYIAGCLNKDDHEQR